MRFPRAAARIAPVALPFLLAVVLLWPATVGGKVMSAGDITLASPPFTGQLTGGRPQNPLQIDSATQFEPDGLQVRAALRSGRLPVWTNAMSAGQPLLAVQQSAPLFPLTWLNVVLPYWHSLAWIAVLKLVLAAWGTFVLARTLGIRRGPALLGGLAFAFGSYVIAWLMHPHVNAYVLLPWLFVAAERLCRRGSVRDAAALGGLLGLTWLGGQPESALIVSLATASWVVHRLIGAGLSRRELVRRVCLAVGAAVLGLAIAAVMLLPFAEALRQSYNTSRSNPPLPLNSVLSMFFPEYWGRPDRVGWPSSGPVNFTERTLYVGVLPLLLAVAAVVGKRPRGPRLYFSGLTVAALVIALHNPIANVVRRLPVLDQINVTRAIVLAAFALAMLAAFGCERLIDADRDERRRIFIGVSVVAIVPVLVAVVAHPSRLSQVWRGLELLVGAGGQVTLDVVAAMSVIRWLVFALVVLALIAAVPRLRTAAGTRLRTAVVAAVLLVVAVDLLTMGSGYNPAITAAQASPPTPPAVVAMRRLTADGSRVTGINALPPNTAARWGLRDARGHETEPVQRTQTLWSVLSGGSPLTTTPNNARTPKLLDVFGVRAVLLPRSSLHGSMVALAPPLRTGPVAYSGPGGVVVENGSALPPAFVAYRWRKSTSLLASLFLMAAGTAREAFDTPVIEGSASPPAGRGLPATPARIVSQSDTAETIDVRARAAGHLILLNTFYPGWHAQVDGHSAAIEPANAAFEAVAVPPGHHRVRFYYRPASVIAGGAISIAAIVVLLGCLALGGRRRSLR